MEYDRVIKEYDRFIKSKEFKMKVAKVLKVFFSTTYFAFTAYIPIYVFQFTFSLKGNLLYAITISAISIIMMDIVCSILEDAGESIYEIFANIKEKKLRIKEEAKKKKEEEVKKLEKLLLKKNDYTSEIQCAKEENREFEQKIEKSEDDLPKKVVEKLKRICNNMKEIIEVLEKDIEEYYPLRHTFKVYFPEFKKATYQFINIAEGDSLDEETVSEFMKLVIEFEQYLNYIKGNINKQDKLSLNIGIKSLVKILEAERKKGGTECGKED